MPRDISSSSSEDEADTPTPTSSTKSPEKQKENDKRSTKYQCPADFVSFCHKPCSSTLAENLRNNEKELWLIKAPANFNPERFSGVKVPLSGFRTLKVHAAAGGEQTGSSKQIYSILASTHVKSDLCLLTSDKQESDRAVFGPTFCGVLNICENYGDSSTNQAPQVIPATPAPSIPPGLRQRFLPFGSRTPTLTCKAESEADGYASSTLRPLVVKRLVEDQEEDEGWKKKKKKKRADEERVRIKEEPVAETQEELMMEVSDAVEEKRKKKKKKKDRERGEVEESVEHRVEVNMEEIKVKTEPVDTYGDVVDGSGKKKKKKKKNKTADD